MALISLVEYAQRVGISPDTARQRAGRGAYKTAVKIGRNWLIDENEQHIDGRKRDRIMKSFYYIEETGYYFIKNKFEINNDFDGTNEFRVFEDLKEAVQHFNSLKCEIDFRHNSTCSFFTLYQADVDIASLEDYEIEDAIIEVVTYEHPVLIAKKSMTNEQGQLFSELGIEAKQPTVWVDSKYDSSLFTW